MGTLSPRFNVGFEAESHLYTLDGSEVISVTQLLDASGLTSYEWSTERDLERGKMVHRIAELIASTPIRGKTVEEVVAHSKWDAAATSPALVGYGLATVAYLLESGITPLFVEQRVASKRFNIAGTLDLFGRMPDGRTRLVDFKSGHPTSAADLQTAGYAMCLKECMDVDTDERQVVWVRKDGTYKAFPPRPAGGPDLSIFQCAVTLFHWRRKNKLI